MRFRFSTSNPQDMSLEVIKTMASYKNICNYIDISGGLETSRLKDISKIDIFLNKVKRVNDEN